MPDWPPVTDDLPAPRDDEPSSLRQDIADELADHLNCAFTRELHLARDEEKAKENALDRFGDPRKIARKLWLDAMQEKLMSQRMTFVALVVVLLASLGSTALTWFLVDQSRQVNQTMLDQSREANAALLAQSQDSNRALVEQSEELLKQSRDANRALVEQGQKANEALLTKLGDLRTNENKSDSSATSLEWNPVKVRLYTGETPGRPAVGYEVRLDGFILDTAKKATLTQHTNSEGIANFGLVRPGQHSVYVKTPWAESREATTLTILPGEGRTIEIACPDAQLESSSVDLQIGWPDDLKARNLWVLCHFVQQPRMVDGRPWNQLPYNLRHRLLFITSSGAVMSAQSLRSYFESPLHVVAAGRYTLLKQAFGNAGPLDPLHSGLFIGSSPPKIPGQPPLSDDLQRRIEQIATKGDVFLLVDREAATTELQLPRADYRLRNLLVSEAGAEIEETQLWKSPIVAGLLAANGADHLNNMLGQQGSSTRKRPFIGRWSGFTGPIQTAEDADLENQTLPLFSTKSGRDNHWRITLPTSLIDLLRANLEVKSTSGVAKDAGIQNSDRTTKE